ncbi:MAG: hypothetical protein H6865_05995 [Rhodospirillales bacterium]|nr:hypothetical protein [Alphaproteobacteria bacterium]MCB9987174.1 hypothetical protein [Rhodospirillales bacterium]USO07962.1 MAG: hypothetical protein H6866_01705 [Rhodospirillales bacterium]
MNPASSNPEFKPLAVQTLTALWAQHKRAIDDRLVHGGWLAAWRPRFKIKNEDWFNSDSEMKPKDKAAFVAFLADRLFETDPAPDKSGMHTLMRWFRFGMAYDQLPNARALLERLAGAAKAGTPYEIPPYMMPQATGQKRSWDARPAGRNPLHVHRRIYELEEALDLIDRRRAFAANRQFIEHRDQKYLSDGGAILHAATPGFRLYGFNTREAFDAYCKDTAFGHHDDNTGTYAYLELATGARHLISLYNLSATSESYSDGGILFPALLRATPGLARALAGPVLGYLETGDFYNRQADRARILLNFAAVAGADGPDLIPPDRLAETFTSRYVLRLKNLAAYAAQQPEVEDEDRDEDDHSFEAYDRSERAQMDHQTQTEFLHFLPDILQTLSQHKKARDLVEPALVADLISAAATWGCEGTAQRALSVALSVPAWRRTLGAAQIAPLYANLLSEKKHPRSGRWARDRQKRMNTLAHLFALVAKHPDWRDGSEAQHLPHAITQILHTRDWAKLKTILSCASMPNNEVSAQWRAALPPRTRAEIRKHRFDNEYKRHYIDRLLLRLDAMERGDAAIMRLRDMPNTNTGIDLVRRVVAAITARREQRSLKLT